MNNSTLENAGSSDPVEESSVEYFVQQGVSIKSLNKIQKEPESHNNSECHYSGTLKIIKYKTAKCIDWKPSKISIHPVADDWSIVDTDSKQTAKDKSDCDNDISINLETLKSYKIKKYKKHQISLYQIDGSIITFIFEGLPIKNFVTALKTLLYTEKEMKDHRPTGMILILGKRQNSDPLCQSIRELQIFPDQPPTTTVWNFIRGFQNNSVKNTYNTFAKIRDVILTHTHDTKSEKKGAELFNRTEENDDFTILDLLPPSVILPRPAIKYRGCPLDQHTLYQSMDKDGQILNVEFIKNYIFLGGCENSIRRHIWKYLLNYYPWNSNKNQQVHIDQNLKYEYERMKSQWLNMSSDQASRFKMYIDRKNLIDKDVIRTDRTSDFYSGYGNKNIVKLHNVLMTYIMFNFDLGYVQGMSDLLSPILIVMNGDEIESFWCFVGFMNRVNTNFELQQTGMKKQLNDLHHLISILLPDLEDHLKKTDSSNMYFCFRWLLVLFKREFVCSDTMRLWEVLWTDIPCANFHLLICVAILENEKDVIINENYGLDEILKHINNLSQHINLDQVLTAAYNIYEQLKESQKYLQDSVNKILGFPINCLVNESCSINHFK